MRINKTQHTINLYQFCTEFGGTQQFFDNKIRKRIRKRLQDLTPDFCHVHLLHQRKSLV